MFSLILIFLHIFFLSSSNALQWCQIDDKTIKCFENDSYQNCNQQNFSVKHNKIILNEENKHLRIECEKDHNFEIVFVSNENSNEKSKSNENFKNEIQRKNSTLKTSCKDPNSEDLPDWGMTCCGLSHCFSCRIGWGKCARCEGGYYLSNPVSNYYTACYPCGPGSYSSGTSTSCSSCSPGYYSNGGANNGCSPCGPGTYSDGYGWTTC